CLSAALVWPASLLVVSGRVQASNKKQKRRRGTAALQIKGEAEAPWVGVYFPTWGAGGSRDRRRPGVHPDTETTGRAVVPGRYPGEHPGADSGAETAPPATGERRNTRPAQRRPGAWHH